MTAMTRRETETTGPAAIDRSRTKAPKTAIAVAICLLLAVGKRHQNFQVLQRRCARCTVLTIVFRFGEVVNTFRGSKVGTSAPGPN